MSNKASKGSSFERDICRRLSLWWTAFEDEPRTDVFWRTSNSGGRATTRAKSGLATYGSYGDIHDIDPIGRPLLRLVTIELKRGYNKDTIHDLLDKPAKDKKCQYHKWFVKAEEDAERAGSKGWLLITKRDRREPLVLWPDSSPALIDAFLDVEMLAWNVEVELAPGKEISICIATLDNFLKSVDPVNIIGIVKSEKE